MPKKHQKHTALIRPAYGEFHQEEWGFIGAPCGRIQDLTADLIAALSSRFALAYVDADHAAGDSAESMLVDQATQVYTDKINFHRFDYKRQPNAFERRPLFASMDAVLVNGNHFKAKRQVVILDPKKEESLSRKLDKLTNVSLILTTKEQQELYPFLSDHLQGQSPRIIAIEDKAAVIQYFQDQLTSAKAPLYALVLAGGKSTRMGEDKSMLSYHGAPQRMYLAKLLAEQCEQVYYSVRANQEIEEEAQLIKDSFTGLGPYGAILSAFREQPNAAWLVVACDLPLLDQATIQQLVGARNTSKLATAFHNPTTNWPAPLVTIWEPRAYPVLLQFLAQGYSCPRKVLINADVEILTINDADVLLNANSPAERALIMDKLAERR